MEFSKWNKRITIWLLLIAGFYMGLMEYTFVYFITFLGSGLTAMGITVWGSVKLQLKDNPPPDLEQHDPQKSYIVGNKVLYRDKEYIAIVNNGPCEFNSVQWICIT